MTYKQIETSREIRQWIKMLVPVVGGALYLDWRYPDLKSNVMEVIKSKFRKDGA